MFEYLPEVLGALLVVFGGALVWRLARQAMAGKLGARVPSVLLAGADRTWVVFTGPDCGDCRVVVTHLRRTHPTARVTEVDVTRAPTLARRLGATTPPTAVLADRRGRVRARLVGVKAVRRYTRA